MGTLANSVDTDEMLHDAAFNLGLHCWLAKIKYSSVAESGSSMKLPSHLCKILYRFLIFAFFLTLKVNRLCMHGGD